MIGSGCDYTDSAKRLIAFAAGNSSYRGGPAALQEFCGIPLSHNTVSAVAVEVADEIETKLKDNVTVRKDLRRSLGVGGALTALGDGAAWIWIMVCALFYRVEECLDIFHAAAHISDCGKILYKNAEERKKWFEEMRMILLKEGDTGVAGRLRILQRDKNFRKKQRKKVFQLRKYFRKHRSRMNIGSGRRRDGQSGVVRLRGRAKTWWENA